MSGDMFTHLAESGFKAFKPYSEVIEERTALLCEEIQSTCPSRKDNSCKANCSGICEVKINTCPVFFSMYMKAQASFRNIW